MTDARGRRARWTTAMVATPGAAVVFGAAVAWAHSTGPASFSAPVTAPRVSSPAASSPPTDPRVAALRTALDAQTAHNGEAKAVLARLKAQVAAQVAAAKRSRAVSTGSSGSGNSGSGNSGSGSSGSGSSGSGWSSGGGSGGAGNYSAPPATAYSAAPPPPVYAQPAPPPPVQATSGASGKP